MDVQIAGEMQISVRGLQRWETAWRRRRRSARGLGRPPQRSARAERQRLLGLLSLLGPHTGVPTLHAFFPKMARREVQDLVRRYRRVWRRRHRRLLHVLHWQRPGTVWAMDFAEPPAAIDGCYPYLLAIRDLASGKQLLWLPLGDETATTAAVALRVLFQRYGPPLVLKSDNGSAFIATETKELLEAWRVEHLRSPPEWPAYNGACEAGIGSMKTRTQHQAALRGSTTWSCDDVEAARLQANETARPWGIQGPTPDERWQQRVPMPCAGRSRFRAQVREEERRAREEQGGKPGVSMKPVPQVQIARLTLTRALVAQELLSFTRERRLPPRSWRGRAGE